MRKIRVRRRSTWFNNHQRAIATLGALIVLATFIVKDAIRDHVKDTVDTLDSARSVYEIHADNQHVYDELRMIGFRVNLIWDTTPERAAYIRKSPQSADLSDQTRQSALEDEMKFQLDSATDLLNKMPHPDSAVLRERAALPGMLDRLKKDDEAYGRAISNSRNDGDDLADAESDQGIDTEATGEAIDDFAGHVLESFERRKAAEDKLLTVATVCSYLLYALGSVLTIAGRVYGLDTLDGTE